MAVKRNAAVKVVVFHWPCGMGDRHPMLRRLRWGAGFIDEHQSFGIEIKLGLNHAR